MVASLPIKVTYQGVTRRFREPMDKNRNLDLDMDGLKGRIFSLFDIPSGSDVSIAYVDDGNDMVNLIHDVDLQEAMTQNLECLKIMVCNGERVCSLYSTECTISAPYKHQSLPDLSVVAKYHAATGEMSPSVCAEAGNGNSASSAIISSQVLAVSNTVEEHSAPGASKEFAFGESSLSSRKGIERGIEQVPPEEDIRQLQLENEDLKKRVEQLLQQIKGKAVVIGDAPVETSAPIIRDSREPSLPEDDHEARLQREVEALRSKRERLLDQNMILREIERNRGQLQAEIEALSNENERLQQQNQNVEESNRAQREAQLGREGSATQRRLEYNPQGEEENGAPITITPPVNSSEHLTWLMDVVPSLGRVLMNVEIPSWLRVTLQLLLSLVSLVPWGRILENAYSIISLVRNTISSRHQLFRETSIDVMDNIVRAMATQTYGRLLRHST